MARHRLREQLVTACAKDLGPHQQLTQNSMVSLKGLYPLQLWLVGRMRPEPISSEVIGRDNFEEPFAPVTPELPFKCVVSEVSNIARCLVLDWSHDCPRRRHREAPVVNIAHNRTWSWIEVKKSLIPPTSELTQAELLTPLPQRLVQEAHKQVSLGLII